jgi:hypothetical protein
VLHLQSAQLAGLCFNEPRRLVDSLYLAGWAAGVLKLPPRTKLLALTTASALRVCAANEETRADR